MCVLPSVITLFDCHLGLVGMGVRTVAYCLFAHCRAGFCGDADPTEGAQSEKNRLHGNRLYSDICRFPAVSPLRGDWGLSQEFSGIRGLSPISPPPNSPRPSSPFAEGIGMVLGVSPKIAFAVNLGFGFLGFVKVVECRSDQGNGVAFSRLLFQTLDELLLVNEMGV